MLLDGRASSVNWANKYIKGIVHAWFPGEFCGQAVAEVLWGDYNPGGRLAVTFPKSVDKFLLRFLLSPDLIVKDSSGFPVSFILLDMD